VRLVSVRRQNTTPKSSADDYDLAHYFKRIETLNSQPEAMGFTIFTPARMTGSI
jgi:hypothetical protein